MTFRIGISRSGSSLVGGFDWTVLATAWADEVGPLVRDALRREAPVSPGAGSGRLRNSIAVKRLATDGTVSLTFTADTPYAGFVVGGTAPHEIRPRSARVLRWQGPGGPVFARIVHHPGTRPNDFARRAVEGVMPLVQRRFREIVQGSMEG